MHPVLIDVDGFALHTYGALGAAGFLVLCAVSLLEARRKGWDTDKVVDIIFWTALAAIAGSRVLFFLQNPGTLTSPVDLINLRTGGLVFYGAFVALPVGLAVIHRTGLPLLPVADMFARSLPLAHGIARLGCFGAGCCYGSPTDVPWAVTFTDPLSVAPHDVALHPTQLYEAAGLFALFSALTWYAPRKRFDGQILLLYLGGYAALRFAVEFFRGDPDRYFLIDPWLSTSQAIAVGFAVVVAVAWPVLARRPAAPTA